MQNPYYGGEMDEGPTAVKTIQNSYYGGEIGNEFSLIW